MFPPPDSVIGGLVAEHGLEVMPITGSMLNIHYGGRLVRDTRPELMPFRLPLSLRGRISFARAGLKVKRDGDRYMKLIQPRPGRHRGRHPPARRCSTAATRRSPSSSARCTRRRTRSSAPSPTARSPSPSEISQSAMAALFGHVWDSGDLGRNMRGGSGLLPEALGAALGDVDPPRRPGRARSRSDGAGVRVRYAGEGGSGEMRARTAIVAVPAPLVPGLLRDCPPSSPTLSRSCASGRWSSLSLLHRRDRADAVGRPLLGADAGQALQHVLQPRQLRCRGRPAEAGQRAHGLRRRRPRARATSSARGRRCATTSSPTSTPSSRRCAAASPRRWSSAGSTPGRSPRPGRWRAQAALERGIDDRIFFAGDWVSEFVSMETAARTGIDAAVAVCRALAAGAA